MGRLPPTIYMITRSIEETKDTNHATSCKNAQIATHMDEPINITTSKLFLDINNPSNVDARRLLEDPFGPGTHTIFLSLLSFSLMPLALAASPDAWPGGNRYKPRRAAPSLA